jgi:hypothetical protein
MTQAMTYYETLSLCISGAGFAAVIITLVLLMKQTNAMIKQALFLSESTEIAAYQSIVSQIMEVDKLFIKHSELRAYFYSGKYIDKTNSDYEKVIAISEYFLDYFEVEILQARYFPKLWPQWWEAWKTFMKNIFANSPIMCEYLTSKKGWYIKELIDVMELAQKEQNQNLKL